jgi:hypothetical protein
LGRPWQEAPPQLALPMAVGVDTVALTCPSAGSHCANPNTASAINRTQIDRLMTDIMAILNPVRKEFPNKFVSID